MTNATADEHTRVLQASPLILDSDTRTSVGPFMAYFPPSSDIPTTVFVHNDLAKLQQAASWPCWNTKIVEPAETCWQARSISGKGIGMFAKRKIAAGEVVISERPVCIYAIGLTASKDRSPEVRNGKLGEMSLRLLGGEARNSVLALANSFPAELRDETTGKLETNMLSVRSLSKRPEESESSSHNGYALCCPTISRINHSCSPNLYYYLNFEDLTIQLRAFGNIEAGEELSISYTSVLDDRQTRKAILRSKYFFDCTCSACSLPDEQRKQSDENRSFLKALLADLEPIDRNTTPRASIVRGIVLAEKEGTYGVMAKLWYWGSRNGLEMGWLDLKQQVDWLKKARMWYQRMQGDSGQGVADMDLLLGLIKSIG